jgi:cell division cycle protein 20 (cofactor of APC complex)
MEISHHAITRKIFESTDETTPSREYREHLSYSIFGEKANLFRQSLNPVSSKVLFTSHQPCVPKSEHSQFRTNYFHKSHEPQIINVTKKIKRQISPEPWTILDACDLVDDFYLNILDWSHSNQLAIALSKCLWLWNPVTKTSTQLMTTDCDYISSISFSKVGQFIAAGEEDACIQICDYEKQCPLRIMRMHFGRVVSLDWHNYLLASGSYDKRIIIHDVRMREHDVARLQGHTAEVCGLKWSEDGIHLASGGNDNVLNIWDKRNPSMPLFSLLDHEASIKALAWCPFQRGILASGGGTADRTIRLWDVSSIVSCINITNTGSQVSAIQWCRHDKELVSSHGYSQNELCVWKIPRMDSPRLVKIAELKGHQSRVLHLALNPDSTKVASVSSDETLRIWEVFEPKRDKNKKSPYGSLMKGMFIK